MSKLCSVLLPVGLCYIGVHVFAPQLVVSARSPQSPSAAPARSAPSFRTKVTALRLAITGQESGGNPNAINPHSAATGLGQVMPANIGPWTQAAIGRRMSRQEFLNSPQAQIQVMEWRLGKYLEAGMRATNNDERQAIRYAAAAWYGGLGNARLKDTAHPQIYNGHRYPSFRQYTNSVLRKYERAKQQMQQQSNPEA